MKPALITTNLGALEYWSDKVMEKKMNTDAISRYFKLGGLGRALLLWFLAISIIPLTIVGILSYENALNALHQHVVKSFSSSQYQL